jgi:hypothetical protein
VDCGWNKFIIPTYNVLRNGGVFLAFYTTLFRMSCALIRTTAKRHDLGLGAEQEWAFEDIKEGLISAPVLCLISHIIYIPMLPM